MWVLENIQKNEQGLILELKTKDVLVLEGKGSISEVKIGLKECNISTNNVLATNLVITSVAFLCWSVLMYIL